MQLPHLPQKIFHRIVCIQKQEFFPGTDVDVHSLCDAKLQQFNSSHQPVVLHESFFHLHPVDVMQVDEELYCQQLAAETKFRQKSIEKTKRINNKK